MAADGRHSTQTANHIIEAYTYANAAARTAATGFVAADLGKIAYQTDTGIYYRLTATTPTWVAIGGGGAGLLAANNLSDVANSVSALANVGGAPNSAHFLTTQAESLLTNEFSLGSLATGLIKNTVAGAVSTPSRAIESVDYYAPGLSGNLDTISGLAPTHPNVLQSVSGVWASRTPAQLTASLPAVIGDSGAGGTKGLVPAPGAGDASAGKFLKADGTFAVPTATAGGGAPDSATYLTRQSESGLSAEFNLGGLTSGVLKHTVSGGISTPATAIQSIDYYLPGASGQLDTISGLAPGNANFLSSVSGVWSARTPAQAALNLAGTSVSSLAAGNDSRFFTIAANNQTGTTYTLALSDAGGVVECNNGSAIALTVPAQASVAWVTGTTIEVWQQGAGAVTLTPAAGVTIRSDGAKLKTNGQYATVGLRYRGNNEWVASGDLSS